MKKLLYLFIAIFVISCSDDNNPVSPTDSNKAVWEVTIESTKGDIYTYYYNDDKRLSSEQKNYNYAFGKGIASTLLSEELGGYINPEGIFPYLGSMVSMKAEENEIIFKYDSQGYLVKLFILSENGNDTNYREFIHTNGVLKSIKQVSSVDSYNIVYRYKNGRIIGIEGIAEILYEYDNNGYLIKVNEENRTKTITYKDNYKIVEFINDGIPGLVRTIYLNNNLVVKEEFGPYEITYNYENGRMVSSSTFDKTKNTIIEETTITYKKIG